MRNLRNPFPLLARNIDLPLRSRLPPHLLPQPPPRIQIMAPNVRAQFFGLQLPGIIITHMATNHNRPGLGLHQLHDLLSQLYLGIPVEEVEK